MLFIELTSAESGDVLSVLASEVQCVGERTAENMMGHKTYILLKGPRCKIEVKESREEILQLLGSDTYTVNSDLNYWSDSGGVPPGR
tara:strand:- start:17 stop:277 length:261 start_codon:yes stop_codon:yes gene_type:complete